MAIRKKTRGSQPSSGVTWVEGSSPRSGSSESIPKHSDGGISTGISRANVDVNLGVLAGSNSSLDKFLATLGNATGQSNAFLKLLLQIATGNANIPGTDDDDLQQKLIEMYLSQLVKDEQRNFDKGALDEQRLYDNPQNQLARFMGAGISRDAAIQMMQGTSDSALVGSGADAGVSPFTTTPTEKVTQAISTALGFASTIGSLVGLGFSIPQAIQQTHMLSNANLLSDMQLQSYNIAGKAYSILSSAGVASEAFDSVGSAVSALNALVASGNAPAAEFVNSGDMAKMQQYAPFTSNVLRDMYKSEHGSEMFRKELKRADLQNTLMNADIEKTYQEVMESLQRILESDERIKEIRQNVSLKKAVTTQEEYAAHFSNVQNDILSSLENMTDDDGNSFSDLMSKVQFNEIWMHFQDVVARTSNREQFREFLRNNWNAACDLAAIDAIGSANYRGVMDDSDGQSNWYDAIFKFHRLMEDSGISEDLRVVGAFAGKAALNYLTPVKTTK